jgi:N-acetylneuraminic acid mutarotase
VRWPSRSELLRTAAVAAAAILLAGCGGSSGGGGGGATESAWSFAPTMPHRRSYTASAQIGGDIYVAAGMVGNTGRSLNIFERFDPGSGTWTSLPFVPSAFSAAAGAALGDRMYVVGGNDIAENRKARVDGRQVFAYDVGSKRWTSLAPMPAARTNLAAVAIDGRLYALGGLDPVHPTRTVFVYDPARNRWAQAAPLPEALHALAAVAFHGRIWVIGGQDRSGTATRHVWIYDPKSDRWQAGPRLPVPLETAGAAVVGDRIDVVLESVYLVYDPTSARWRRGPSLEVPRHALAVYAADGTLYALGGCVTPQLEDSAVVEKIAVGA